MTNPAAIVHVAAALVTGADGRGLVVRKHGGRAFIQPGGKIEPGEAPIDALVRELREELGLEVLVGVVDYLGVFEAPALDEPGATVRAETFAVRVDGPVRPRAEIAELAWIDGPDAGGLPLAPLSRDVLLPLWAERCTPR